VVEIARELQDQECLCAKTRDLALYLCFQGKCAEALTWAEESLHIAQDLGRGGELNLLYSLSNYGTSYFKCGMLEEAETTFLQAVNVAENIHAHYDYIFVNLASLYEVSNKLDQAEHIYQLSLKEARLLDRNSYACSDLTGFVRVNCAQKNYSVIPSLWAEAMQLAQEYEYNEHIASLYLTRGHIIWDALIPEWESEFDAALHYYQLALIHALRFNRFLLDEVLVGREHGTPLRPIIRQCLEGGEDGRKMLMALRDWWQSGMNDIGTPRSDTISPLPEGISLMEAERIAREREPGIGTLQQSVIEQINAALGL
jgi:tetratricopeptide (TPR) repeat protein